MIRLIGSLLLLGAIVQSKVEFQNSVVLQENDLFSENRAAFKCSFGCKVYTDSRDAYIFIVQYDEKTNHYDPINNFAAIGGPSRQEPVAYVLAPSKNYYIENRGSKKIAPFVFYAVGHYANDNKTPVRVITDASTVKIDVQDSKVTVLSSATVAVTYSGYSGPYLNTGYPRIYGTGYEIILPDSNCDPIYQARSLENANEASITIFSPISTFVFGKTGKHSINVAWNRNGTIAHNPKSSVVYMSPGYAGINCHGNPTQNYYNAKYSGTEMVADAFQIKATSLTINGNLDLPFAQDSIALRVNNDNYALGKSGGSSSTFHADYNATSYDAAIKWAKKSPRADFSLQLDFATEQ